MKLRTKFQDEDFKLGEVVDASIMYGYEDKIEVYCGEKSKLRVYDSIKDLTDHWEDAPEEPKIPYFINWFGEVSELSGYVSDKEIKKLKEIGNYFSTREETELVVEKLKAWQRLKDWGFKFCGEGIEGDTIEYSITRPPLNREGYWTDETHKCFDLLFGGEK